jgi:hypothetical protein
MNRLYVVETRYTITGAVADHRAALRPSEIAVFADALRRLVVTKTSSPRPQAGEGPGVRAVGDLYASTALTLALSRSNIIHQLALAEGW